MWGNDCLVEKRFASIHKYYKFILSETNKFTTETVVNFALFNEFFRDKSERTFNVILQQLCRLSVYLQEG